MVSLFGVPVSTYFDIENREQIQDQIRGVIEVPFAILSKSDFFVCEITTQLETDPGLAPAKHASIYLARGINNQGRVHSQNIAARQYDNLLFRSRPEIFYIGALKAAGSASPDLSVALGRDGVGQRSRRIEPDFTIFKDGFVTIVEVDGDLYHTETPHEAHVRLKFLLDEGVHLERINANECDTDEKAREAVERILLGIEKRRKSQNLVARRWDTPHNLPCQVQQGAVNFEDTAGIDGSCHVIDHPHPTTRIALRAPLHHDIHILPKRRQTPQ